PPPLPRPPPFPYTTLFRSYATRKRSPRTFGWKELHGLLSASFHSVETLLPLPDYKLPTAIIRAELTDLVNCAELFANTTRHDFGDRKSTRLNSSHVKISYA